MRKISLIILAFSWVSWAAAQEEKRVEITGFEDELDWKWTGGNIEDSFVEAPPDTIGTVDGQYALHVYYNNNGSTWQYISMSFPGEPVDLTGMRELHIWFYIPRTSTGDKTIRIDFPGDNILGNKTVSVGKWVEVVWKIDRYTSNSRINTLNALYGFIVPSPATAAGDLWIDKIYAVRPANTPEVQEFLIDGFNEADHATKAPVGWTKDAGVMPEMGNGLAEPSEGVDCMKIFAGPNSQRNVKALNLKDKFNRWGDVVEIMYDVFLPESMGWVQNSVYLRSGIEGARTYIETQTDLTGYAAATTEWKTLCYNIDMTRHVKNLSDPKGYLQIILYTEHGTDQEGKAIMVDNLRVGAVEHTGVPDWSLY